MESKCCQFGHQATTTALSSISSDRAINAAARKWRTDTREQMLKRNTRLLLAHENKSQLLKASQPERRKSGHQYLQSIDLFDFN